MELVPKILITAAGLAFGSLCEQVLSQRGFAVYLCVPEEKKAIFALVHIHPDFVLAEAQLHDGNAISLKREYEAKKVGATHFYCMSCSDQLRPVCMANGFSGYYIKPFDISFAASEMQKQIKLSQAGFAATVFEQALEQILLLCGFRRHNAGYAYLFEALLYLHSNDGQRLSVTKQLYPSIAKRHGSSAAGVEKAIRYEIEKAWKSGALSAVGLNKKPTNTELIEHLYGLLESKQSLQAGM